MLNRIEARVLGCLLEKEQATPEYYPLTLNALTLAANQKSNRDPVLELAESEVARALDRLQDRKLVWKIVGGRVTRWQHNLDSSWSLDAPSKAVMTLLLLRGPQTAAELRTRSERLHRFESADAVEASLRRLAEREDPLVEELPRAPGQKERRWKDRLTEGAPQDPGAPAGPERKPDPGSLTSRLDAVEESMQALAAEIRRLKDLLGG